MLRYAGVASLVVCAVACGGSTSDGSSSPDASGGSAGGSATGGGAGSSGSGGATGGSSSVGGSAGTGATGGLGGTAGSSGSGGVGGSSGSAGSAGTGGLGAACAGLSYCDCKAQATQCEVYAETCFCPCGVEPCEPNCSCSCSGGKYLGCGPAGFTNPGEFPGVWLFGWAGGLNHYSWVRMNPDFSADFQDGANIIGNAPFWPCSGKGSWIFTAKPNTVSLTLPASCMLTSPQIYTLDNFRAPGSYLMGATLAASAEDNLTMQSIEAYKFHSSQCDAQMTVCMDPFM